MTTEHFGLLADLLLISWICFLDSHGYDPHWFSHLVAFPSLEMRHQEQTVGVLHVHPQLRHGIGRIRGRNWSIA